MIIPFSARAIIFVSLIISGFGVFIVVNNSKEKIEYDKLSGLVEYYHTEFQDLPYQHKGDYRYLKVDSYPYLFEIYEPNNELANKAIDILKVGDFIDIYFYETSDTRNSGINRFAQFIDVNGQSCYIRNGFQSQLGYVIIGLCIAMVLLAIILMKTRKINW